MKSFKQLLEALNVRQQMAVNRMLSTGETDESKFKNKSLTKHVFPEGQNRIEIPVENELKSSIEEHLKNHEHTLKDYVKGTATDLHGRDVKIGKVLEKTKAPEELKSRFQNDDRKTTNQLDKHKIVVSREPEDIAGCSTNRKWSSCAKLTSTGKNDDEAARHIPYHIKNSMVAYLVKKDDNNIDNPVSRIMIHPHKSEDTQHEVFVPESSTYSAISGSRVEDFKSTLDNWTKKQFPMKKGEVYKKNPNVYDDDGKQRKVDTSLESLTLLRNKHGKNNTYYNEALEKANLPKEHIDELLKHHKNEDILPLQSLAKNKNLTKEHIDNLIGRNQPAIDVVIARHKKITPEHVDTLVNRNDSDTHNALLGSNNHTKLSDQHFTKIINNALKIQTDEHNTLSTMFKDNKYAIDNTLNANVGTTTLEYASHHNLNQQHIDRILKNTKHIGTITDIVKNSPTISNEQLEDVGRHYKDKPLTHLSAWNHPYNAVVDNLKKRRWYKDEDIEKAGLKS